MLKHILTEPNHELRLKSLPIKHQEIKSEKIQQLIADMIETMAEADGIGLAAPQIGIRYQVIIVDMKGLGPQAFINPRITKRSFLRVQAEEGCLSVPGVVGLVKRHRKVTIKAYDRQGKKVKLKAVGLDSIVFQHEVDHLDGILFTDRSNHFTSAPRL
ncbi:MAG: peptide deformylase [Candidatus Uhrbacteria bacterium]